jgi:hypothetical protein
MKQVQQMALCVLVICFVGCARTSSQTKAEPSHEAKTKLEAFEAKTGVVIIRGFSKVGSVSGQYGGRVSVEAREFLDASGGKREYGITIEVAKGGEIERENTSYIDYDEIESLLRGIDYISKVQRSVTKLEDFEADYRTRGDFRISTFSGHGGEIMAAVSSGVIGEVTAFLPLPKLEELRGLIVGAKEKLDSIK